MRILGISAFYHDAAAAIVEDGRLLAACQEERFSRIKHDSSFPIQSITYCLEEVGISLDMLDAIAFYDKPLLKFERLLETYYAFAPKGIQSFVRSIPVWIREKLFLKRIIREELSKIDQNAGKKVKLYFPEHHLSHAASAYYPSNFTNSAILTIDGVGEWATASICKGEGTEISVLKEMKFPHSIGLLYSAFTYWLGFKVNSGEYKLMGLAPYGISQSGQKEHFKKIIRDKLVRIYDDGSIWMNQKYFNYSTGLRMVTDVSWENLFGLKRRSPDDKIEQDHCNLALAIQEITEEVVEKMATHAKEICKSENLCLAGGVALNCVANGKLLQKEMFDSIFIQPAAGDAGGSVGAAFAVYFTHAGKRSNPKLNGPMNHVYLGPKFHDKSIQKVVKKYKAPYSKYDSRETMMTEVAKLISDGAVVGWFQGRMEFGPRALGNRSILGDPRNREMQKKLNLKIKNRESFRPFAPSVLEEDAQLWFDLRSQSPHMLFVAPLKEENRNSVPDNYDQLSLMDRLYVERSDIPAITHIDFSARIQTVSQKANPEFWNLLQAFKEITGLGMLINTSFNVRGEPIVCTPEDAFRCFMRTEMYYLVIEQYLFSKNEQDQLLIAELRNETFLDD